MTFRYLPFCLKVMVEEEPLPTEGHRVCLLSDIHVMNLDLVENFENSSFPNMYSFSK